MSIIIIDKSSISFDYYFSISELLIITCSKHLNSKVKESMFLSVERILII